MIAEILLVALMVLGPVLVALAWEVWDDRRLEASIRRQLDEAEAAQR